MAGCAKYLYDSNMTTRSQKRSTETETSIQTFSLFGESAHLPDVLHCETIAARSALHDWELSPHRHGQLHQLLLLTTGGGAVQLEGQRVALAPLSLVNIAAGDVHAFSFQRGTQGWVTTLADELLGEILAQAGDVRRALGQSFVIAANENIRDAVARIAEEFNDRSTARALVLRGLAATLLGLVARAAVVAEIVTADLPDSNLLRRFEALLEQEFLNHWSVSDYARALAVSPTHLSRVTRAATGRAASYLIDERIVREARRNLAYTQLQIATIADTLGFNDAAYFSRVFTRVTGVSPRLFRAQLFAPTPQKAQ